MDGELGADAVLGARLSPARVQVPARPWGSHARARADLEDALRGIRDEPRPVPVRLNDARDGARSALMSAMGEIDTGARDRWYATYAAATTAWKSRRRVGAALRGARVGCWRAASGGRLDLRGASSGHFGELAS